MLHSDLIQKLLFYLFSAMFESVIHDLMGWVVYARR